MSDTETDIVAEGRKNTSKPWILGLTVIALVLLADQALKYWVVHHMELHTERPIIGKWFLFHYTLNNGMAFGLEFGGQGGKILLSVFRILAVAFGFWYLRQMINKGSHRGFIVCVSLILAGAMGNIIDSMFYGIWYNSFNNYEGGFLMGRVVDMLYFPIVEGHYPSWSPIKPGQEFIFFSPVFNLADAAISTGVIAIFVFQKKFFKRAPKAEAADNTNTAEPGTDIPSESIEFTAPEN